MRRALVLSNEASRHPFRASLPAHVFETSPEMYDELDDDAVCQPRLEPEVLAANAAAGIGHNSWWQLTRTDVRGFASVYLATFLAVLVFIM